MTYSHASLSLFWHRSTDQTRGVVLWGEGAVVRSLGSTPLRSRSLGDGLRVLSVSGPMAEITTFLTSPRFEYKTGSTHVVLTLGLEIRPPVPAITLSSSLGSSPSSQVYQFVRKDKRDAFHLPHANPDTEVRDSRVNSAMLSRLGKVVGLDFLDTDAALVGSVFIVDGLERTPAPIQISSLTRSGLQGVRIARHHIAHDHELHVGVTIYGSDRFVIKDTLVHIEAGGAGAKDIETNQPCGGVDVKCWRDGVLVYSESIGFVLNIETRFGLLGSEVQLRDRLVEALKPSKAAAKANAALIARASRGPGSTETKTASGGEHGAWRVAESQAAAQLFRLAPPPPPPWGWFPVGAAGRAAAILNFAELLSGGPAFLVDPFFDESGAEDLLPRAPRDADITVVTSLAGSPQSADRLQRYLRKNALFLPTNLKIIRATSPSGSEQAFHDRSLVILPEGRPPEGYSLTNSFSGMARRFPLVVAKLPVGTTAEILVSLAQTLAACDTETLWRGAGAAMNIAHHATLATRMRLLAKRLRPRGPAAERKALMRSIRLGFITIGSQGLPTWSRARARASVPVGTRRGLDPRSFRNWYPVHVGAIGELRASAADPDSVPAPLPAPTNGVAQLIRCLIASFVRPDSSSPHGLKRARLAAHQGMLDVAMSRRRVRHGLAVLHDDGGSFSFSGDYDRVFIYRTLLNTDAAAAVATALRVGDPALLAALCGSWEWPARVHLALLQSNSSFLQALALERGASNGRSLRFEHTLGPRDPTSLNAVLSASSGVCPPPVLAAVLFEWAVGAVFGAMAGPTTAALVLRVGDLSSSLLAELASIACRNSTLLGQLVQGIGMVGVSRSGPLIGAIASEVRSSLQDLQRPWDCAEFLAATEDLVTVVLWQSAAASAAGLAGLPKFSHGSDTPLMPLSPLRRHPDWRESSIRAASAHYLNMLSASGLGREAPLPEPFMWDWVLESCPALFVALRAHIEENGSIAGGAAWFVQNQPYEDAVPW